MSDNPFDGMDREALKADILRQAEFVDAEYKRCDEYIEGGYSSPLSGSARAQIIDQRAALAKYMRTLQKRLSSLPEDNPQVEPFGVDTLKTSPRSACAGDS